MDWHFICVTSASSNLILNSFQGLCQIILNIGLFFSFYYGCYNWCEGYTTLIIWIKCFNNLFEFCFGWTMSKSSNKERNLISWHHSSILLIKYWEHLLISDNLILIKILKNVVCIHMEFRKEKIEYSEIIKFYNLIINTILITN